MDDCLAAPKKEPKYSKDCIAVPTCTYSSTGQFSHRSPGEAITIELGSGAGLCAREGVQSSSSEPFILPDLRGYVGSLMEEVPPFFGEPPIGSIGNRIYGTKLDPYQPPSCLAGNPG